MNGKTIFSFISLAFVFALAPAQAVWAASQLSVSPSGANTFVLQGTAMEGVAAMDITLRYDTAALANPRVDQGSLIAGALMAVNAKAPGTVRIGVIRTTPIQGSGTIATLRFDSKGNSTGKLLGFDARLSASDGSQLPVKIQLVNPTNPGTGTAGQPTSAEGSPQSTSAGPAVAASALATPSAGGHAGTTLPSKEGAGGTSGAVSGESKGRVAINEPDAAPASEVIYAGRSTAGKAGPSGEDSGREVSTVKSVLDRFKEFAGIREPRTFIALFKQERRVGFRQEPSIVLADGTASMEVVISPGSDRIRPPDVAVMGARLVSMERDPDRAYTWVLKLRPGKAVHEASLAVPMENSMVVFPLVVAPRLNIDLDKSGTVTEDDFSLFLKNGKASDLNGDGKRDYLDEYLFTANYLVTRWNEQAVESESVPSETGSSPIDHEVVGKKEISESARRKEQGRT